MNIKTKIGTALLLVLISLIFFSKTIYTYNLAIVTAGKPSKGSLYKVDEIMGTVNYTSTWDMYVNLSGKATEVLVKEGDKVLKGDLILRMGYDTAAIEQSLSQLEISRAKLDLEIESINMQIAQVNSSIEELTGEVYKAEETSIDGLKQFENDIEKAESDYARLKMIFDAGGLPQKQLDESLENIEKLNTNYESLKEDIKKRMEKEEGLLQDKEKDRNRQLEAYNYSLQSYKRQLKVKELDLKSLYIQEESSRNNLNTYAQNVEILAPSDGIVTWLGVAAGQRINEGQRIFEATDGFKVECFIPEENDYIVLGDIAGLPQSKQGKVTKIENVDDKKKLTLEIEINNVNVGDSLNVRFQKRAGGPYTLIDNGALKQDGSGYFIYQIKRRNGILGKEYYSHKMYVETEGSDGKNTAIIQDIGLDPVILLSD